MVEINRLGHKEGQFIALGPAAARISLIFMDLQPAMGYVVLGRENSNADIKNSILGRLAAFAGLEGRFHASTMSRIKVLKKSACNFPTFAIKVLSIKFFLSPINSSFTT